VLTLIVEGGDAAGWVAIVMLAAGLLVPIKLGRTLHNLNGRPQRQP
jgi:hypothetical protein